MFANVTRFVISDSKAAPVHADGGTDSDLVSPIFKRSFLKIETARSIFRVLQFAVLFAVVSMEAFFLDCPRMRLVNVLLVRSSSHGSRLVLVARQGLTILWVSVFCCSNLCHCVSSPSRGG